MGGLGLTRWQAVGLLAVGTVVLGLHFVGLGAAPLLEPDEGRYLEIPREMVVSSDWVTPRLDGVLYFEKPPLYYWLNALAIELLGPTEVAARCWNACFGVAGVLLTLLLGVRLGGRGAGVIAAGVLGTSPYWVGLARLNSIDMTLTFFITATLVAFYLAQEAGPGWRARLLWWAASAAAALAVLAKGLVGLVIPAAVAGMFVVLTRRWDVLRRVPWVTGGALFLVIAVPWHLLAAGRNPDFAWFYFVHEHVLRYATASADRHEAWWLFLGVLALGLAPFSGLIGGGLTLLPWRQVWRRLPEHPGVVFLWCWAGFVVAFFSVSQSKLVPYVLPAMPALAVLLALAATVALEKGRDASVVSRGGAVAGALVAGLLGCAFLVAGLGRVARLGLGGQRWPVLLASGALVVGSAVVLALSAWLGRWRPALAAGGVAAALLTVTALGLEPRLGEERSSKALAAALKPLLNPGDLVFSYRDFHESLPVYLQQTVGVVGSRGELAFGISHLTPEERRRRFPTAEELRPTWDSPQRVWLACNADAPRRLAADGLGHFRVVWSSEGRALVVNAAGAGPDRPPAAGTPAPARGSSMPPLRRGL
jgi:4-amino-4-deoxy-L-arabinose transferase-like glycosyltransferase